MDLFDMLRQDHEQVKQIMEQIRNTDESKEKEREERFASLKKALLPHMMAEEIAYYPLLEREPEAQDLALEAVEEHRAAQALLRQLDAQPAGNKIWAARFKVMMESIHHHIEEEEGQVFPMTRKVLSQTVISDIARCVQDEKQRAMASAGV